MNESQRLLSPKDVERRGTELYASKIRVLVEANNVGRFLCIDVESGDYIVADQR